MSKVDPDRLAHAQAILTAFAPHVSMEYDRGFWLSWEACGRPVRRRWQTQSEGSDYPVWYKQRPFGGTCCQAVSQLIRWARGRPVYPLGVWKYWCSPTVGMNPRALELATAAGWPAVVPCVFCGRQLQPTDRLDWHSRGRLAGPGCWYDEGCKGGNLIPQPSPSPRAAALGAEYGEGQTP